MYQIYDKIFLVKNHNFVNSEYLTYFKLYFHRVDPKPIGTDKATTGGGSSGGKAGTVGTIVAVFLSAIVICLLLIVFHKKERRSVQKCPHFCVQFPIFFLVGGGGGGFFILLKLFFWTLLARP